MKMHKKGLTAVFLAVLFATLPQMASAGLYGGWGATPNITDLSGSGSGEIPLPGTPGKDITGVWYAQSGGNNYFRMDLLGAVGAGDHANMYNIYITSSDPGSVIPSTGNLVAMLAFDFGGNLFTASSYTPEGSNPLPVNYLMSNGNTTLEWVIPVSQLGGTFYYMGATITGSTVNDSTSASATPIPNAAWLLGSGIIGLIGLKRRQAKRR